MIKIFYSGLYGSANDLFEMHRFRTRVFRDILKWNVDVDNDYLEFDRFDTPNTVYITVSNVDGEIIGSCRLLSCTGPFMIKELWPQYLKTISIPGKDMYWELSRFAVAESEGRTLRSRITSVVTTQLFYAITKFCLEMGIQKIYAMHDICVQKAVRQIGCLPEEVSETLTIDGDSCNVGSYGIDDQVLANFIHYLDHKIPPIDFQKELFEQFKNK